MLKRKAYYDLLKWKKEKRERNQLEALMILGARQVGKSFLIEKQFSKTYKSFIKINFIHNPSLKEIFANTRNPSDIYKKVSLYFPEVELIPGDTLFFLDEIQNCGDARTALKFLAIDNKYDFVVSGSLLGLQYGENADKNVEVPESIPVGYERPYVMHSLDFEEFLWAKGYKQEHIDYVREFFDKKEKIPFSVNNKFHELFKEYMVVGGMPEVVMKYIETNNYSETFEVQDKLIKEYKADIAKHAKGDEKIKVNACYESVPKQLSKELKKFQYSIVEKGQTKRKYGGSIKWLIDSGLVYPCYNVTEPYIPLIANEKEEQFKLYINDTGLLTQLYGRETKIAILNGTLKGNAKGGIYENIIAEQLVKNGFNLHFYKPNSEQEIEFIIEKDGQVLPVEVKAGNNPTPSLNKFINQFKPSIAYKMIDGNIGTIDSKVTLPHYMIMFVKPSII